MSKWNNRKVTDDGYTFDSQAEHRRYCHLRLMERAEVIRDLRVHVPIELLPRVKTDYQPTIRAVTYEADFVYLELATNETIVEDVKGARTDVFNLKWNMLQRMQRSGALQDALGAKAPVVLQLINATDV